MFRFMLRSLALANIRRVGAYLQCRRPLLRRWSFFPATPGVDDPVRRR